MCNLVKYNTEIQRALCDLVDKGILTSTTEAGEPADMSELKEAVANNDVVLAYLVAKYGLVLLPFKSSLINKCLHISIFFLYPFFYVNILS